MLEDEIKKEKLSWSLIRSNFFIDDNYLNEIGIDEDMKRRIKND